MLKIRVSSIEEFLLADRKEFKMEAGNFVYIYDFERLTDSPGILLQISVVNRSDVRRKSER